MGIPGWPSMDPRRRPRARARFARAWERFVGAATARACARRSRTRGGARTTPGSTLARAARPVLSGTDETAARWHVHPLVGLAPLFRECFARSPDGGENLLVVSDRRALLWIEGDPRLRHDAADGMNFAEGTLWSEGGTGTNAVGTALAADHAVQVFAAEHFNEFVQAWSCSAAPIHDPEPASCSASSTSPAGCAR